MTTTAKKKPKQRKPSHAPMAFLGEKPCEVCGSEWFSPGIKVLPDGEMEEVTLCANLWHNMIAQLRAQLRILANLASDAPQFADPLAALEAKVLRNRILAGAADIKAGGV